MIYDPEANILCLEVSRGEITHVREFANFIIHVSKTEKPILIEILDASKFIGQIDKVKVKDIKKAIAVN
ncbi:MAG: DUF2283 domain-containing protein [Patescibacteria group bacterium]